MGRMIPATATIMAVLFGGMVPGASAQGDWHRWRGPAGTGVSADSEWTPVALSGDVKILWKVNVGRGYSAVSVAAGRVYTMGNERDVDVVHCLREDSGETIWTHEYPCRAGSYPGPRATPYVDGNLVFTMSRQGDVLCLDAATGEVKWQHNIETAFGARAPRWGHSASPWVEGELLLVNGGRNGIAFDKRTGRKVWASPGGIGNYATPVVATIKGMRCALIMGLKDLYGVEPRSGRVLWTFPWEEPRYDVNAADPIVSGTLVFVSSGYGRGCAVFDVGGPKARQVWENRDMASHFSSAVEIGGYVYGIDGNAGRGHLVCLDLATGERKWRQDLGFGSLIAADGKLIVLNERGGIFVAEASPSSYRQIAAGTTTLAPRCWTPPVLSRGRLYCRNQNGDLVCLDVSK